MYQNSKKQAEPLNYNDDNGPISRVVAKFLAQKQINLVPGGTSKESLNKLRKHMQLSEENRRNKSQLKSRNGNPLRDNFLYNGAINRTHDYHRGENMMTEPREFGDESALRIFETADNRPTRTEATPEKKGRRFPVGVPVEVDVKAEKKKKLMK